MEGQERNDKPEQTASDKAIEHQAERLADIERPSDKPTKSRVFAVFNAYLILVGTIIGFGVLAFYTGHKLTADIVFYLSIPLLGLIPVALVVYLLPMIRKQVTAGLDRLAESRFTAFLDRHLKQIAYAQYVLCLYQVADGIRKFPNGQRASLILIGIGGFNFITMRLFVLEITLRKRLIKLTNTLYDVSDILLYLAKKDKMPPEHKSESKNSN
jgi:hypothetical protein